MPCKILVTAGLLTAALVAPLHAKVVDRMFSLGPAIVSKLASILAAR